MAWRLGDNAAPGSLATEADRFSILAAMRLGVCSLALLIACTRSSGDREEAALPVAVHEQALSGPAQCAITPSALECSGWYDVRVRHAQACAINLAGDLYCWGSNHVRESYSQAIPAKSPRFRASLHAVRPAR
jgi:hypothetical protein